MTLAELRLLAWQRPEFPPCGFCGENPGRRCVTASGARTVPHKPRLDVATGWVARQGEVDGLTAERNAHRDMAGALGVELADRQTELTAAYTSLTEAAARSKNDQAAIADAQRQFLTIWRDYTDVKTERDRANERVETLEAQVAALTPKPTTRYGMNVSPGTSFTNGTSESSTQQASRIVATYGTLAAAKTFRTGMLPATYTSTYEGLVTDAFVCFKVDQNALARGDHDAAINRYLDSIPAGRKVRLVNWQEPDDEMWKDNVFTTAQHRAATDHLCDLVHAHAAGKDGRAEVWDCYMGFSLDVGRFDWAAVSPKLDGIGWDRYWNKASDHPEKYAAQLKEMADRTKAFGVKQWALLETGDNPTTFADGAARAKFWAGIYDEAARLGYSHVLYFNAIGTTGDHRIIPGQPYSDPMVALLKGRMAG